LKVIFKTKDPKEGLRMAKSLDMAIVLFEIQVNLFRQFKDKEAVAPEEIFEAITELYDIHGINTEHLID
jgi:hypothetical protein